MSEIITDNDAQYALDIVKTICTEGGPGVLVVPRNETGLPLSRGNWHRIWVREMWSLRNLPLRRAPS
jgi:hypothetical protein